MDTRTIISNYLRKTDWRVKENANTGYSFSGLALRMSEDAIADYMLNTVYTQELKEASDNCYIKIHDSGYCCTYCVGHDLKKLLNEGLNGVPNKVNTAPPKHMNSAVNIMVNYLGIMQMESAGAQAFPNFSVLLAPFAKADNEDYDTIKQHIQNFIYHMNISNRWGAQAVFSNITLDFSVPSYLKGTTPLVGGKDAAFTYDDCVEEMNMINKAVFEIMKDGDASGQPFAFPIITVDITKDFPWDSEISKLVFKTTAKYGLPYFQNYIGSDLDPEDVLAMCPMTGDTEVIVKSKQKGITLRPIQEVYNTYKQHQTEYQTWTPGGWAYAIPTKQKKQKIYELTLSNGFKIKLGENHLQPIKGGKTVQIKDIVDSKEDIWIPFSNQTWNNTTKGCYDWYAGYVIGAFLGDGTLSEDEVVFSLSSEEKDDSTERDIRYFFESLGYKVKRTTIGGLRNVRVKGKLTEFIRRYVKGKYAHTKELTNHAFDTAFSFRNGIIDGHLATDGAKDRRRIYTTSPKLATQICEILSSTGNKWLQTNIDTRPIQDKYRLPGQKNTERKPLYRIDCPQRVKYGDYFDWGFEPTLGYHFNFYKLRKIEEVQKDLELYCFEVDNEDSLFTLASGMVTHNCRLQVDKRELQKHTGGLFGSGISTGSLQVVTLNLPKYAYEAKGNVGKFFELIRKHAELAKELHEIKREFLNKQMEYGLYPYMKRYIKSFDTFFSTIGIVGGNEACLNLIGQDISTYEGKKLMVNTLKYLRELIADFQEETGHMYNLEATPAESTAYKLARFDKAQYPDIVTSGTDETPYYTNSTHLKGDLEIDIPDLIEHQESLQNLYNSGTVLHFYLGEQIKSWRSCMKLVKRIATNSTIPYFSITPTFSVCPICGYITGEHEFCPNGHSEEEVEKYMR